jgi:hypothetical protein
MTVACQLPPIPIGKHCGDLLVILVQGTQYAACLSYSLYLKANTKHVTIQYNRTLSLQFNLHHLNLDKDLFLCWKHSSEHSVATLLQYSALAARTAVMTEAVM